LSDLFLTKTVDAYLSSIQRYYITMYSVPGGTVPNGALDYQYA